MDHTEMEWQFGASDAQLVFDWIGDADHLSPFEVARATRQQIQDAYFDTEDRLLLRAGYKLRFRNDGTAAEATLKTLARSGSGLKVRREFNQPLPDPKITDIRKVRGPVSGLIESIAPRKELVKLFTVNTRRTSHDLLLKGQRVAELILDDFDIEEIKKGKKKRLLVEVEVADGKRERLQSFVEKMQRGCRLDRAAQSKFAAGLESTGLEPRVVPELGPLSLKPGATASDLAFFVLRSHFEPFLLREPGIRLGQDPEELHQMRVSIRRLRSAIRFFSDLLPASIVRTQNSLKWIGRGLGAVRDLDVKLQDEQAWKSLLPDEDRESIEPLIQLASRQREQARKKMLRMLNSKRYRQFVANFSERLRRGPTDQQLQFADHTHASLVERLRRIYRKTIKRGKKLNASSRIEDFHQLRIQCKRLRYALEFCAPVFEGSERKLHRRLVRLQNKLGRLNDASVHLHDLKVLIENPPARLNESTVFAAGMIAAMYQRKMKTIRRRFPKAIQPILGKPWRNIRRNRRSQTKSHMNAG